MLVCLRARFRGFRLDVAQGGSVPSRLRGLSARGGWRTSGNSRSSPGLPKAAVRAVAAISALHLLQLPANVIIELLDAIIAV